MSNITLRCEICNQDESITQIYLDNLAKTGWNKLLCSECLSNKFMNDLISN